jgi:hypothetical protein
MRLSPPEIALSRLARCHQQFLDIILEVSDGMASYWNPPTAPSIKWHLWHMARWADYVQSMLAPVTAGETDHSRVGNQLWDALGIADDWGFDEQSLGTWGVGSQLTTEEAQELPLPGLARVVGYARSTFEMLERRFAEIDDGIFDLPFIDWHGNDTTVGDATIGYLAHANRHLGMIEALRGVRGQDGTATI